jgi:hypothetical protein
MILITRNTIRKLYLAMAAGDYETCVPKKLFCMEAMRELQRPKAK